MMDGDQLVSRKRGNHSGPDFLSDLPLDIIHRILEHVPIREAVRTCILSRRWSYIWATLPHLVFKGGDLFEWKGLKTFINKLLFLHKGPIHKFRLVYPLTPEDRPDIDRWLLFLFRNEIRDLFLGIRFRGSDLPFWVHSSIYSCQKLTHLQLENCILLSPPPTFKGFSCLKSLALDNVKLPFEIVESLVANSPLLENFSYDGHSDSSELTISAPNLKCFCLGLSGDFEEITLYAPLVAEVTVSLEQEENVFAAMHKNSDCNFTKFLGGCTNLETLTGFFCFTKYLSIGIDSYDHHSLVFYHLKDIILEYMSFEDEDQLAVVGHLMMGAPNLRYLSISHATDLSEESPPRTSYSDFGCGPDFTFNKLRSIRMGSLRGLPREKEIIKYLLKSSPVLETMDLYCYFELTSNVKLRLRDELLCYFRVSPNAKLLIRF